ncbi:SDR family NAD(P)-dependent oxidoreductase [Micromonospora echinofusca]|uniref:3-oxoacyl-[acyl-carrier protein] reductase n=1 Tax=Micromonospora echinofusca TaxID=47858 RepID=A0A1C5GAZ7_MICEH|nr:SDR family oxidoreductase [Micromonospora echinofusca]SCG17045.1 3-oxoacyl-[acyl-carrier protein] reductase [Micromonospora echinofusca]
MSEALGTVFVTGGTRGIGLAVTRQLLTVGYRVVAVARTAPSEFAALRESVGDPLTFLAADLTSGDDRLAVANRLRERADLHGLVNNAGVASAALHVAAARSDMTRMWQLNVEVPMSLSQAAVKAMYRRGGRIVNITSIAAHRTFRGLGAYTATKCALEGFSRVLAAEVGSRGITVNCVAPGFIDTAMTASIEDGLRAAINRRNMLNRAATVADVARSVEFLLSPAAEAITAQVLRVDSGSGG